MPRIQKPDGTVAGSAKRLAARFYQLKTGHARTGEYLHWTKARPTAQCWWCPHPKQTREHLLKGCPRRRKQQKARWKEVWEETGGGRFRWKAHELFAEQSCSQAEELGDEDEGEEEHRLFLPTPSFMASAG